MHDAASPPPTATAVPSAMQPNLSITNRPLPAPLVAFALGLVLASVAGVLVMMGRQREAQAHEAEARKAVVSLGPFVRVVRVNVTQATRVVSLPAEVRAAQRAQLYAKVSGYVQRVLIDKGDRVKKGQLLAEVESPDNDQQALAAKADLELKRSVLSRVEKLLPNGAVSQADVDNARSQLKVAESAVARAGALQGYEKLRAPFDGVVTARFVDPGALLPAATSSTTSAQPLLELASGDKLRINLQLGQEDAALVRKGDVVTIDLPGGTQLEAKVSRLSQALDPRTRTMLAEIDLGKSPDNLYPGAYVQVALVLRGTPRPLVPAEALITRGGALVVPTVIDANKVHLVQVRAGIDDGRNVEIVSGLKGGELVALNLGADAVEGGTVQPLPDKAAEKR